MRARARAVRLTALVVATLARGPAASATGVTAEDRAVRSTQELPTRLPPDGFEAREVRRTLELDEPEAKRLRREALARARVWLPPSTPIEQAELGRNPDDPLGRAEAVVCKFHPAQTSGSTAKFECVFEGGEVLKVKYGRNPEIHTEAAASRLMAALGAGADRIYLVPTLRCFGCPEDPDAMLRCLSSPFEEFARACQPIYGERLPGGKLAVRVDYSEYRDFPLVAVERRADGLAIEAGEAAGWSFRELDETARAPAQRAERDALRLLAVLLNNWDTRSDNQRLLCLDAARAPRARAASACRQPLAYMQDVGATFGYAGGQKRERKLDVEGWRAARVFEDEASCGVRIDAPAFHGATFGKHTISEGGRRFLAERLSRLREPQIRELFEGARFADYPEASAASRDPEQWVQAFQDKVRQITEREPCPVP